MSHQPHALFPTGTGAAIFGCEGTTLSRDEAALFAQAKPFGFILFARNVESSGQLMALCNDLRSSVGWDAPIFMDQEGGTVQRMRPPLARNWANANAELSTPQAVRLRHTLMAAELRAVGVDGNCAPVIDVAGPDTHPFLQKRIWSDDPARVAELGRAAADGLMAGGVMPVIKHVPGHGAANADSHFDLPVCTRDRAALEAHDFVPVRALADLPFAMTSHVVYSAIDPDRPATHSDTIVTLVREELGVQGLLMTDDIDMKALGGTLFERAQKSIAAGCDVVLHCWGGLSEMDSVAQACGGLSDGAQKRAQRALQMRQDIAASQREIDIAALTAEFDGLTQAQA